MTTHAGTATREGGSHGIAISSVVATIALATLAGITSGCSPRGVSFASANATWTQEYGTPQRPSWFGGCSDGCYAVAFSADGQGIVTGHGSAARRWNATTGELSATYPNRSTVHSVQFSPDGNTLAFGGYGNSVTLIRDNKVVAQPDVGIVVGFFLSFSADGSRLLTDGAGGRGNRWDDALLWDTQSTTGELTLLRRFRTQGNFWRGVLSADGTRVFTGDSKGAVRCFDAESGKRVWQHDVPGGAVLDLKQCRTDGRVYAVSSYPIPQIDILDSKTGRVLATLPHDAVIRAIAVSKDGRWIASAGNKAGIRLYDTHNGSQRYSLVGHEGGCSSLEFSPNGDYLLSGGFWGSARLWRLRDAVGE